MRSARSDFAWFWIVLIGILWGLLFAPRILPGVTIKSLAWMAISAFLFLPLFFRRKIFDVGVLILALVGVMDIFHYYYFGDLVDEYFTATVFRTNKEEMGDFLISLPWPPLIASVLWMLVVACLWFFLRRMIFLEKESRKILIYGSLIALAVWAVISMMYVFADQEKKTGIELKVSNIYPMHLVWAVVKQRRLSDAVLYEPVLPALSPISKRVKTIVVVIGESASAQRWSLLGYSGADTNTGLRGVPGLRVVKTLARGVGTVAALPFVLTGLSVEESIARRAPSFLDLAKKAGYKVFVLDNSRSFGGGDFFGQVLRRSTTSYKKVGNGNFDDVLTSGLIQAVKDPALYKLIVLHTFGSHEIVTDRYPKDYEKFDNPYDNSILYTGDLLAHWINLLQTDGGEETLFLYTSDHGLSMPPCTADYIHGRSMSSLEVPFVLWASRGVQEKFSDTMMHGDLEGLSNAILGEKVVEALGYGELLKSQQWSGSRNATFDGHDWSHLGKMNACTLR